MSCGVGRRRSSDPALLWLWRRLAATALIRSLADTEARHWFYQCGDFVFAVVVVVVFCFCFCLFAISWAAPMAYGGSQARGLIGAVATSLRQSHSNAGSEPLLRATPQLTAMPDL